MNTATTIILITVAVMLILKLFSLPIRWIFRLLLSTATGFIFLIIINYIGAFIGIMLGLNIINAFVIGVLGLPGLILLLLIKLI